MLAKAAILSTVTGVSTGTLAAAAGASLSQPVTMPVAGVLIAVVAVVALGIGLVMAYASTGPVATLSPGATACPPPEIYHAYEVDIPVGDGWHPLNEAELGFIAAGEEGDASIQGVVIENKSDNTASIEVGGVWNMNTALDGNSGSPATARILAPGQSRSIAIDRLSKLGILCRSGSSPTIAIEIVK